jgi:hypothetical protein
MEDKNHTSRAGTLAKLITNSKEMTEDQLPEFDERIVLDNEALREHLLSIGDRGRFATYTDFPSNDALIDRQLEQFEQRGNAWRAHRLLLYVHGGGIEEARATRWSAERLGYFLRDEIYPIAPIWHSDKMSQLRDAFVRAVQGEQEETRERSRQTAAPVERSLVNDIREEVMRATGRAVWADIKADAENASASSAGVMRRLLTRFRARFGRRPEVSLHVIGYSAGAIFAAHVVQLAGELGLPIESCMLWGPGCTLGLFNATYRTAVSAGQIKRLALYNLLDEHEVRDSAAMGYQGSVLFAVSRALEEQRGEPLLGLERCIAADSELTHYLRGTPGVSWVRTPQRGVSLARRHRDFDDDPVTIRSTIAFIRGAKP